MAKDLMPRRNGGNDVDINTYLQSRIPEIASAFPGGDSERIRSQIFHFLTMALTRNQELLKCVRETIVIAAQQAGALGLDLNPHLGEAYLVPRFNSTLGGMECCLQVGYQGLVKLVRKTKQVTGIRAAIVYDGDEFSYEYTPDLEFRHRPAMKQRTKVANGSGVKAVYAYAKLTNGENVIEVMTVSEVEDIRARSKSKNSGPWVSDWCEMAKKTALRRMVKMLPKSDDGSGDALAKALEVNDNDFDHDRPPQIEHNSGHGTGKYCSPKQAEEYSAEIDKYIAKRNTDWDKKWTDGDTGQVADGVSELTRLWEADKHLTAFLVASGRLDRSVEPDALKNRQIGRFTGIAWFRSVKEQNEMKRELRNFIDGKEREQLAIIQEKNPHLFGGDDADEDFSDWEGVEDAVPVQDVTPLPKKPESLPGKTNGKKTPEVVPVTAEDDGPDSDVWRHGKE